MTNERTNEKRAAPPRRRVVAASISTSPSSRPFRADVANERSDHACMTVYLNQSPRTPKRRLTGAACVVVTPFIRASSGGAAAFARRRIHPSSTSRDVLDAPSRASNAPKHFFASNDRLRASRRASRRATTTDVRRPTNEAGFAPLPRARRSLASRDGVRGARRVDAREASLDARARDGVQRATRGARDGERRDRGGAVDVLRGGVLVHRDEGAKGRDGRRDRATRGQGEGRAVGARTAPGRRAAIDATRRSGAGEDASAARERVARRRDVMKYVDGCARGSVLGRWRRRCGDSVIRSIDSMNARRALQRERARGF